ncbi:MAG: hypothetical protein KJO31_00430 [Gammaproteobacteria bacterium]|nr:hypothetical protein [Gammaproteobacteria bacterium]
MYRIAYLCFLAAHTTAIAAPLRIDLGDGTVDGRLIGSYRHNWLQCALQDEQWVDAGIVTEETTIDGDRLLHSQTSTRPDGIRSVAITVFDRASFAPLVMELAVTGADGQLLATAKRELDANGYKGMVQRGAAEPQSVNGTISSTMFHGAVLGLPLATLDYTIDSYELAASMMNFDAQYRVIVRSAGTEKIVHNGREVVLRLVDVEWHHDNGDVYPPGPDASGGRYWLLAEPVEGLPPVVRYKTDSYAVGFLSDTCAAIAESRE